MKIFDILAWLTKRTDQIFKWHGGYAKRKNEKTVDVSLSRRDVDSIKRMLRQIDKKRKTRRNSS